MRGVEIDPEARIARVEAGALWMDVTGPAAEHGLAALAGSALRPEIDTITTIPVPALAHMHMDPPHPVPGKGDGMLLKDISAELIDDFVDSATGDAGSALVSAEVRWTGPVGGLG